MLKVKISWKKDDETMLSEIENEEDGIQATQTHCGDKTRF